MLFNPINLVWSSLNILVIVYFTLHIVESNLRIDMLN